MINRSLEEIAVMAGGTLSDPAASARRANGVSKDTRTIEAGNLYVPLIGEAFDGHAFAADALARGAVASLWQADRPNPPTDAPLIVVDDTLLALQRLASAYRRQLAVRIVGITGSNGKTTTKDLTAAVLSASFRVHKTAGNYNNHIGLPLTLLALDEDTEVAVLEMGMSGRGEIELLSRLAAPEVAVITNIGEAHLLQLGSRDEIARAKTEIAAGLQPGGTLVYNGDEPLIAMALSERREAGEAASFRTVRFGAGEGNDYYPERSGMNASGSFFHVRGLGDTGFEVPLLGAHNVVNAVAALAVGALLGMAPDVMADGLRQATLTGMRIEVRRAPSGLTILNDAYNASPTSMRAAIGLLHELSGYARKFAVLGDMLELGPEERAFHREVGRMLDPSLVDAVYLYGPLSEATAKGAQERFPQERVRHFADKAQLSEALRAVTGPNDVVLVKGSRGMRMEEVAGVLMQ